MSNSVLGLIWLRDFCWVVDCCDEVTKELQKLTHGRIVVRRDWWVVSCDSAKSCPGLGQGKPH